MNDCSELQQLATIDTPRTKYIDLEGNVRVLTYLEPGPMVTWTNERLISSTTRYLDETGRVIQIPDDAWEILGIEAWREGKL